MHVPSQTSKVETAHDNMNDLFVKYDIAETSYHLHTGRIDLHLCDDATAGRSKVVADGRLKMTSISATCTYINSGLIFMQNKISW